MRSAVMCHVNGTAVEGGRTSLVPYANQTCAWVGIRIAMADYLLPSLPPSHRARREKRTVAGWAG